MVLIGDTNQLKPIIVFEEHKNEKLMKQFDIEKDYDYYNNSILSTYKTHIKNISIKLAFNAFKVIAIKFKLK